MTPHDIRSSVIEILQEIADEEIVDFNDNQPIQEQLELDSMDFLDMIMDLRKSFSVQIPEDDYTRLTTMREVVSYLEAQLYETQRS